MVNSAWESLHAVFLYEDHDFNAMKYVLIRSQLRFTYRWIPCHGDLPFRGCPIYGCGMDSGDEREKDMRSIDFRASIGRCHGV